MAEAVLYLLNSTDDSTRIAIQPRTFDGVGGVQRNTDLTLYGNGAPNWGERFDENFYHLMEHFAVAQQTNTPFTPENETDLAAVGFGINEPIIGQVWYNKTTEELFVYNGSEWRPSGKVSIIGTTANINSNVNVTTPRTGELAYDTDTSTLKIYNGSAWVDSVNTSSAVPTSRTVTGTLSITGGGDLSANRTFSLVNDQNSPGVSTYYGTNAGGVKGFFSLPSGGSVTSVAASGSTGLTIGGSPITTSGTLTFTLGAELQALSATSGTGFVQRSGGGTYSASALSSGNITGALGYTPLNRAGNGASNASMAGYLDMGSNLIRNVTDPALPQDAATKAYVDAAVGTFTELLSTNGYVTLPNGIIFQWGFRSYSSVGVFVSFPITFPNACFNVQATQQRVINDGGGRAPTVSSLGTTGFTLYAAQSSSGSYWYATGY
jgi:hypothetical protein